jgi:hypothetical protein
MSETEFFIVANSFAASFFSDTSEKFVTAPSAKDALEKFAREYKHPAGLYAALCYRDANARAKGEKPLAKWLSNHEIAKMRLTEGLGGYSYYGDGPGRFRINDTWHTIADPRGGLVVDDAHPSAKAEEKGPAP